MRPAPRLIGLALLSLLATACPEKTLPGWPQLGSRVPEISGTRHDGAAYSSTAKNGKVSLLFFGYTFCPDVCPITLLSLKQLLEALPKDDADRVEITFVTVDPERDTVERLASYLEAFGTRAIGVRPAELERMKKEMLISVEHVPVETSTATDIYSVNHTATIFLISADGRLIRRFSHGTPVEEMRGPLEDLLAE